MTSLVVTLIGPDRPGMVSAVSDCAAAHGANWSDSLMANFADTFAGIVHLQVPPQNCAALTQALQALQSPDFQIVVAQSAAAPHKPTPRRVTLDLVGHDHPGIIRAISSQLASHGVGIDKLQTRIASGAGSGEAMFHMQAQLTLPAELDTDDLRAGLESLSNELMVDIDFDGNTQPD